MHPSHLLRTVILVGGLIGASLLVPATGLAGVSTSFVRGDSNADGKADVSDAVHLLGCAFLGTECPTCADSADVNDDGQGDISDAVFLLAFLFLGGEGPAAPSPDCGVDPTEDALGCESFAPCGPADPDSIPTAMGDLLVRPIEHATLVLQWDELTIFPDPVGNVAKLKAFPAPDIIFVTHSHGDHMDRDTILAVAGEDTVLVVPQEVLQSLNNKGGVGDLEVKVMANGDQATIAGIGVEAVPMYNARHPKGQWNGYVLDFGGTRVYIAGDTEGTPEMRALEDIALAFIPMNLPFTMSPEDAAAAVLEFKPGVVYPYHYRNHDTEKFKTLVEEGSDDIEVRLRNWYPGS